MKLHEYQARELLEQHDVPVPPGQMVESPEAAIALAESFGGPVVVKAQVLTGGRGKAGGVKLAATAEAAGEAASDILGLDIKGYRTEKLLVVKAVDIVKEYYLSFTLDRARRSVVLIYSAAGGVDIEDVAASTPERIHTLPVSSDADLDDTALRTLLAGEWEDPGLFSQAADIVRRLYRLFVAADCSLVEVNPLVVTSEGAVLAADAKVVLDDSGLMRHPELEALRNAEEYTDDEVEAREAGLSFVSLDGEIGCMVNGAGLAMATMDGIKLAGGNPANFLDVGGSSNPQKVLSAMQILLRNAKLRAVLINIFGGITRCDDIARGIILANEQLEIPVPVVIRLIGTNQEEGHRLLSEAGFVVRSDMSEALREVVAASREGGVA